MLTKGLLFAGSATLSLMLGACGSMQDEGTSSLASSSSSCSSDDGGGTGGGRSVEESPDTTGWTGVYNGDHAGQDLIVLLGETGETASLTIDGDGALALRQVAWLYCSESIGMYGDGATRGDSKVLVTLFRTPSNERSIKVSRWDL